VRACTTGHCGRHEYVHSICSTQMLNVLICLLSSKGYISHTCGVSDRSKLSAEEYDALYKLVKNHVLIDCLGDVFKKAVSTVLYF
jgi:hypothetical protein